MNNFGNPFEVRTPEALSSSDTAKLFVDVFTDFHKIKEVGHTFINGPRGTGKSMMLRYLEPDVQLEAGNVKEYNELKYYAIHIPIKKAWSDITEWGLLKGASYHVIAEHVMVSHIMFMAMKSFKKIIPSERFESNEIRLYFNRMLSLSGHQGLDEDIDTGVQLISALEEIFECEFLKIKQFLRRLLFKKAEDINFDGAIFSYLDFVVPVFSFLKEMKVFSGGPFFLLIDDADQLDLGMQRILNTWVSCRTIDTVCLKIATQMRYKTYRTEDGKLIESPHDYSDVNISSIYTRNGSKYFSRITEIVEKRLSLYGINAKASDFFPEDEKQKLQIEKIKQEIITSRVDGAGYGGNRQSDDIIRQAIPIYMSRLAGASKSSATYSYAGFKNLVDLSSGVIRWFLDPAAKMYSETISLNAKRLSSLSSEGNTLSNIPIDIQDKVIKDWSFEFIDSELPKFKNSEEHIDNKSSTSEISRLFNLITALGELFRARLLDESARERKLSSILITDEIPSELERILNLGVELGYLQKSSIGSKEGRGRRPRFTLSRRLSPYFKLDPSGYAYNLSVTSASLVKATTEPRAFVRERLAKSEYLVDNDTLGIQQSLDF
ncbi:hypothetical protein [Atlantibacter hermannii]|uniref:ORC-CDC6 family AAA ATPase n=1 Tax=Atlantibacter hermannii TaxID=565 RepID=UPI002FD9E84A